MNKIKDGYRYKLFSNSVNQVFRQEIYGQHQLLHQNNQVYTQAPHLETIFSSISLTQNDSELQPRSLSASLLTSKSNASSAAVNSFNIPPCKTINTINLSPRENVIAKSITNLSSNSSCSSSSSSNNINGNNANIIVGSYHSVSDISVLSDNDNDEPCSAYFTSNKGNNKPNSGRNKLLSQSDDFEFLRPKDPRLVLPQISSQSSSHICGASQPNVNNLVSASASQLGEKTNYNQQLYSSTNSLSSSVSSSSSFNNSLSANNPTTESSLVNAINNSSSNNKRQQGKSSLLNKNSAAYENSKSMLFGIPRDSPMPTIASMVSDNFHPLSLDSPFVDITLNNCEDMSLYQSKSVINTSNQTKNNANPNETNVLEYSPLGLIATQNSKQNQQMNQL